MSEATKAKTSAHKPYVVFLNGPPRSGKDTAAYTLVRTIAHCQMMRMSQPLKDSVSAVFALTPIEQALLEEQKDKRHSRLFNATYRQCQIAVSEKLLKPMFGATVLGMVLDLRIQRSLLQQWPPHVIAVADSGFVSECLPIIASFGKERCLLIHLQREGATFEGDSRSYFDLDGVTTIQVTNEGPIENFQARVSSAVMKWLADVQASASANVNAEQTP